MPPLGPHERGLAPVPFRLGGAFGGVLLALTLWWFFWVQVQAPRAGGFILIRPVDTALAASLAIVGGVAGWWLVRQALQHPTGRRLLGPLVGLLLVGFGAAAGLLLAATTYLAFSLADGVPLHDAILALAHQAFSPGAVLGAFYLTGALVGMAVALYVFADFLVGHLLRRAVGAVLGALAGIVIYSFGYVLRFDRAAPEDWQFIFRFAEAATTFSPVEIGAALLGALIGFTIGRMGWQMYGMFTLIALISVVLGYVVYTTAATLPSVPPENLWLSVLLFAMETVSLGLVILYSFYTLDVASRKRWRRAPEDVAFSQYYLPKVAFQVPTYNEPPEMVLDTLRALLLMDYPADRCVIMVADDSTREESAAPVRAFCAANGIQYHHRTDRTGYKAGALNHLLKHTPEDVDLIAVVDADYQVRPDFLKECVGFFVSPNMAWIQTPQDYRNRDQSFLTRQFYLADAYFYRTVLPSRNEENSIIFCGTMGILRRAALEKVGGWGERYITEDAELSIRLTQAGYDSLYINKSYGHGLIPPTFDGYKKQQYRWAFGGAKIFRGYFHRMLFGRFSPRQAMDHIAGTIHWFEGLFFLVIAGILFYLSVGELMGLTFVLHHDAEVLLVGLVPIFILVDGLTRLHMVMRQGLGLSFGQTLGILGMWFSVKFSNMFGAVKALIGFRMPFVRTPKGPDHAIGRGEALGKALRVARFEATLAVAFWAVAAAMLLHAADSAALGHERTLPRVLLTVWLTYYALVFTAAPFYAYRSYVTFRPHVEAAPPDPAPVPVEHEPSRARPRKSGLP